MLFWIKVTYHFEEKKPEEEKEVGEMWEKGEGIIIFEESRSEKDINI